MDQPANAAYDPAQYGPQPAPGWQAGPQQGRRITPDQLASVPLFEDGQDARLWLSGLYRKAGIYAWRQEDLLDIATCRLGEKASVWQTGHAREHLSWPAFEASFLRRFGPKVEQLAFDLAHCHQSPKESVQAYADRYRELMAKLGINGNDDPVHRHNFMRGLREDIYREVYFMKPQTLDDAVNDAVYASGIATPRHFANDLFKSDRRSSGTAAHVRFEPQLRVPREFPCSEGYQEGRKHESWVNRRDSRQEDRWDDSRDSWREERWGDRRDDRQEDRREPPERPRREFWQPEPRAGPPHREASRGLTSGQVEDARRLLERLSLNLRDRLRSNTFYYMDDDELAYMLDCNETDDEWDAYESHLQAGMAYIKRQAAEVGTSAIPVATPGGGRPNTVARGPSYQPPPREEPRQAKAPPAPHPPEPPRTAGAAAALVRPGPPPYRPAAAATDTTGPQHAASPGYRNDWRPARPLGALSSTSPDGPKEGPGLVPDAQPPTLDAPGAQINAGEPRERLLGVCVYVDKEGPGLVAYPPQSSVPGAPNNAGEPEEPSLACDTEPLGANTDIIDTSSTLGTLPSMLAGSPPPPPRVLTYGIETPTLPNIEGYDSKPGNSEAGADENGGMKTTDEEELQSDAAVEVEEPHHDQEYRQAVLHWHEHFYRALRPPGGYRQLLLSDPNEEVTLHHEYLNLRCGQEAPISAELQPDRMAHTHSHLIGQSRGEHLSRGMGAGEQAAAVRTDNGTPGDELLLGKINPHLAEPETQLLRDCVLSDVWYMLCAAPGAHVLPYETPAEIFMSDWVADAYTGSPPRAPPWPLHPNVVARPNRSLTQVDQGIPRFEEPGDRGAGGEGTEDTADGQPSAAVGNAAAARAAKRHSITLEGFVDPEEAPDEYDSTPMLPARRGATRSNIRFSAVPSNYDTALQGG
jgi:hypothetical protein